MIYNIIYTYVHIIHIFTNIFLHFSEGGFFKAHLQFPKEYPLRPPRMKFITEIWHPNSKTFSLTVRFLYILYNKIKIVM